MSAALTAAHPGPALIWHAGRSTTRKVNPDTPMDAARFADRLRRHPSMVGATVEVVRADCVRAVLPGQRKPRLYHGESPLLALPSTVEADARRALIRLNATFQRAAAAARETAEQPGADAFAKLAHRLLQIDADLVARELADLATDTAVEANR